MVDTTSRGRVRVEQAYKRVRAYLGGQVVVDTAAPLYVWEIPNYPAYYVPIADVRARLVETGRVEHSPSRGDGHVYDVVCGDTLAPGAALIFPDSPFPELRETVRLQWAAMDEWLEEDEPIYTHPRDPYTRVDILASSRHLVVSLNGTTLAETHRPTLLSESHLPARWYLPLGDLDMSRLRPSETITHCPYKGAATYWSVEIDGALEADLIWCYRSPLPESQKIAGLAAFYSERVDLVVDGKPQARPTGRH
jgi:uncharacterized protein (DUF427 family)